MMEACQKDIEASLKGPNMGQSEQEQIKTQ